MLPGKSGRLFWLGFVFYIVTNTLFAETIDNPCEGSDALLNLIDRPTAGDSACTVPFRKIILESGFQYQKLMQPDGFQQNYTQSELRFGLPANNELAILLPNYIHPSKSSSGFSAATLGIKHQIGYTQHWLGSIESIVTLPSGSQNFGSDGTGIAFNGIVNYTFNPKLSLFFMFGVTSQTQSTLDGGQRFTSYNPDIILTYVINPKMYVYGEIYGQSETGPAEGRGFNADGGILYLLKQNIVADLEVGQRINGQLGDFNQYIGAGLSVMF